MTTAILLAVLLIFIADILFFLESILCRILDILYSSFEVFAGIKTVMYKGSESYLMTVFFSNDVVSAVFWGMAVIGFALTIGFAIIAVVKKLFDSSGEKVKATYGQILLNVFKSFLLIVLMTALVSATINATGILMQQVDFLFNNAIELSDPSTIEFDDTDMATMFRIMNTIGNYTLNPSYKSRFNINACFNSIRPDMQLLYNTGAFNYTYSGAEESWQYALTQIYNAKDIHTEVDIDSYDPSLIDAMLSCMDQIKTNKNFKPVQSYSRDYTANDLGGQLGRMVMVSASLDAANNGSYNKNPSVLDNLRRPYYLGYKDVYDKDTVEDDFDIGLSSWNHVVALVSAFFLIKEFAAILFNCVARMFNIILLYIAAPGFISVMPLDDGGKMKQWTTAYIIQSLSIFGSVLAVRLLMIFVPIILSSDLVLFSNSVYNYIAKLILVLGVCVTSEKANGLISGILADNAGYQSIMAGDIGSGIVRKGVELAGKAGMAAGRAGMAVGKGVLSGIGTATGASTLGDKIGKGFKNFGQSMRDKGGFFKAMKGGFTTNEQDKQKAEENEKEADRRDTADFRNKVISSLGAMQNGGGNQGASNKDSANKEDKSSPAQKDAGNKDAINKDPGNKGAVEQPAPKPTPAAKTPPVVPVTQNTPVAPAPQAPQSAPAPSSQNQVNRSSEAPEKEEE